MSASNLDCWIGKEGDSRESCMYKNEIFSPYGVHSCSQVMEKRWIFHLFHIPTLYRWFQS